MSHLYLSSVWRFSQTVHTVWCTPEMKFKMKFGDSDWWSGVPWLAPFDLWSEIRRLQVWALTGNFERCHWFLEQENLSTCCLCRVIFVISQQTIFSMGSHLVCKLLLLSLVIWLHLVRACNGDSCYAVNGSAGFPTNLIVLVSTVI